MTEITSQLSAALADRYRIERRLGEGGMATVYLAEDLKPELAAVIGGERFVHEIKVTANLQHPNILALYDSGEAGSILYYVMPYVEGESLRERLDRERQLPVEQAVEIARSVANALDYAHRNGVVHRDIKPENILLHEGQPLVADFGIALAVSTAAGGRLTETGLSLGTPHYMSPEQATAERELDARSDVYSLGVLLYEMLVGQAPFHAPSVQAVVAMILTEEPIRVAARRPSVPPHIEGVVAKAMQKLPADRFSSAQEFGRALSDVTFVGPGTVARAPAGAAEVGRRARSAPAAWVIAATATVVVVVTTMAWLGSGRPPSPVHRHRIVLWNGGPGGRSVRYGTALAPDGSGIAYVDTVGGRRALLFKPSDALEATVLAGTNEAGAPFFSPDGQWIGFFSEGVLRDGSASPVDAEWARAFGHPALSPDARTLAIGVHETSGETNLWLKPLDAGPPSKLTFGGADDRPAWAPDGGSIAFARGAGPASLYQVTVGGTGAVRPLVEASDSVPRINEAAYSPDGAWLIYREISGRRSILLARNLEANSTVPLVVEDYNAYAPTVAPDGRWLAFQSDRTGRWEVYVRPFPNANDGEWTISVSGGFAPRWARNGEEIFYLDEDRTMWSVTVLRGGSFTATTRRPLFDASAYELDAHQEYDVAPDGRFLMVRDRGAREGGERELVWVEDWLEELRAKW